MYMEEIKLSINLYGMDMEETKLTARLILPPVSFVSFILMPNPLATYLRILVYIYDLMLE